MIDRSTYTSLIKQNKSDVLFAAMQKLLEKSSDMIFVKDLDLTYVAGTQSFAEMVGKPSMNEVLGRTDHEIFQDNKLSRRYTADDRKLLTTGLDLIDYVEPLTDKNGKARYSSTSKYILTDQHGQPIGLLGIGKDITRDMKLEQQYHQEISHLFDLPEDTYSVILFDVTDWRIIAQRRQEIGGLSFPSFDTMEEFLSLALSSICDRQSDTYGTYQQISQPYLLDIYAQGQRSFRLEYYRQLNHNNPCWIQEEWLFMPDPRNDHLNIMVLVRDIQDMKIAEEELIQAAQTDEMTGLLNRAASWKQIQKYLATEGADGCHALFMIDLDDFKLVNDTYGHRAGDMLLTKMASAIKSCFRENDIVGRIGGDEFFVLAKNMFDQDSIRDRAEYLLSVSRAVYATHTTAIGSVSIGISCYPTDGYLLDALYEKADEALYKAKGIGKNRFVFSSDKQTQWSVNALARRYESYNSQVVDHSNSICYISDMETYELLHLTKAGMKLYGLTRAEEYLGRKCYQVIMGLEQPCPFCTNCKLTEGIEYRWEWYNPNICKWFDRTSSIIPLDGRLCHLEIGRDITARKEELSFLSGKLTMEDVLFRCLHTLTTEQDMDIALQRFLEAVGGFYQANRAYIFEFDLEHNLLNNTFEWCASGVSAEIDRLQNLPLDVVSNWIRKFKTHGEFSISSLGNDVNPDSDEYRILEMQGIESLMAAPIHKNGVISGFIGVDDPRQNQGNLTLLRSVSEFVQTELEQRRLVKELERMSFIDTLTGLKNRNQFVWTLKEYDHRHLDSLGVISVDINGLKSINNARGHSFGDHIIQRVGHILSSTLSCNALSCNVFRTNGGEFIGIYENVSKDIFHQNVLTLQNTFDLEHDYTVSIGCAWSTEDNMIQNLLDQAEEMLRANKHSYYHARLLEGGGTSSHGFYDEVAHEIQEGRFMVYYQPQINLQTGKIFGAEALVRKKDDAGCLISPGKFIPFYEMQGVIGLIDMFVLDSACSTLRYWMDLGHNLHLSVNFSRITLLESGIVDEMCRVCAAHCVPNSSITIEVTESISKMDQAQLTELIRSINNAGFTISLDDFGSKYSNLAILAEMDFNEIKFDRSLINSLEHNPKSQIVMKNSIRMCHNLPKTHALAEGIETKGQLDLLVSYDCDYGQGDYFSKPIPPEKFLKLLT